MELRIEVPGGAVGGAHEARREGIHTRCPERPVRPGYHWTQNQRLGVMGACAPGSGRSGGLQWRLLCRFEGSSGPDKDPLTPMRALPPSWSPAPPWRAHSSPAPPRTPAGGGGRPSGAGCGGWGVRWGGATRAGPLLP